MPELRGITAAHRVMDRDEIPMKIFASQKAERLNQDRKPFVVEGRRYAHGVLPHAAVFGTAEVVHDPRPEFVPKTTHDPNLILDSFRTAAVDFPDRRLLALRWSTPGYLTLVDGQSIEMLEHAMRVLSRLAVWGLDTAHHRDGLCEPGDAETPFQWNLLPGASETYYCQICGREVGK